MLSIVSTSGDRLKSTRRALDGALACSGIVHACALAAVLALAAVSTPQIDTTTTRPAPAPEKTPIAHIVFLPAKPPGGGGGGGGGNRQPGPIRRAEAPGHDRITIRIAKPVATPSTIADARPSLPALVLDAKPLASGVVDQIGLPTGGVPDSISTGPGSGGGVGTGHGTGIGSGTGPGLGEGSGGGTGGGPYRPGGAVSNPQLLSQVAPTYTADALAHRIQGSVLLELVVTSTGMPSRIRVVRSLDAGLDARAIDAVAQWRFAPGRLAGTPVDVLVNVIIDFTIH